MGTKTQGRLLLGVSKCAARGDAQVFVRENGALSVALHTTRAVAHGEELTFDYSAATSSEQEWRAAVSKLSKKAAPTAQVYLCHETPEEEEEDPSTFVFF